MGDSLGALASGGRHRCRAIVFCGVHFMAETASILSPEKTVLIPDLDAGCSLADSIDADQLRAWKAEHPGAVVVMYVNTSAEVKAETDYCCTSSNAVSVVEHIWAEHGPETEILFGPDMWLGAFVERETGLVEDPERRARFHIWDGECHVHAGIRPEDIVRTRAEHPEAEFLIHPECGCSTQAMEYVAAGDIEPEGVHMLSTSGMLKHVEANPDGSFIVATENGMLYPLQQAAPQANLIEANRMAFCKYMKMITLPKLRDALRRGQVRGQRAGRDRRAGADPDRAHGRDRLAPRRLGSLRESSASPYLPVNGRVEAGAMNRSPEEAPMNSKHSTLVVAGRSADSPSLIAKLAELTRDGGSPAFTLLVPAVPHGFAWATDMSAGWPDAAERAERAAERMRAAGLELEEAIVGDPDPYAAVGDVLHVRRFDEIVVATLPRGLSSWLKIGLPARLGRLTELPIMRIGVDRPARAAVSERQLAASLA